MIVALEGMKFFAFVGYSAEEQLLGNEIVVDISLELTDHEHPDKENLDQTVDYESVYETIKEIMKEKTRLLETLAEKVQQKVFEEFLMVRKIKVRVSKLHPPIQSIINRVYVEQEWVRE